MSVKNADVITTEYIHLIDELQNLLEQQIELVSKGEPAGKKIENLSERINILVEKIRQAEILESAQFKKQKEKLKKSYENLCLVITAQRADTVEQLSQVRRGRKIVKTYRGNKRL